MKSSFRVADVRGDGGEGGGGGGKGTLLALIVAIAATFFCNHYGCNTGPTTTSAAL